jgi:sulfur relay (sulfurtransferase) DsrF/TusC family protein
VKRRDMTFLNDIIIRELFVECEPTDIKNLKLSSTFCKNVYNTYMEYISKKQLEKLKLEHNDPNCFIYRKNKIEYKNNRLSSEILDLYLDVYNNGRFIIKSFFVDYKDVTLFDVHDSASSKLIKSKDIIREMTINYQREHYAREYEVIFIPSVNALLESTDKITF